MLEKPDIADNAILKTIKEAYGVEVSRLSFLPLGADPRSAVYRADAAHGMVYFVKLRRGHFDENSVALPAFLHEIGVEAVIAPLPTLTGTLFAPIAEYTLITYPFVTGDDGYTREMSAAQWQRLGTSFCKIHGAALPPSLVARVRRETFAPTWRDSLTAILARESEEGIPNDPVIRNMQAFLAGTRTQIEDLIARATRYAQLLRADPPEFVLCHADIHAGNVLLAPEGGLYIVDWDDPILAPKERDLMFIGGGLWGNWRTADAEEALFYAGYGQTRINRNALAYYRFERIVEDLAVDIEQITTLKTTRAEREQSLRWLESNFLPGSTIERAYAADVG